MRVSRRLVLLGSSVAAAVAVVAAAPSAVGAVTPAAPAPATQQVLDTRFSPPNVFIVQGATLTFLFPSTNVGSHSATERTAMKLFDTGLKPPGSQYSFEFDWAGIYREIDTATSDLGMITVPMKAKPKSGSTGTAFTVTWATSAPPPNFVGDVQVKRPGSSTWVDWHRATVAVSATFTPDAGPGTYGFRARLRNPLVMASSRWSPERDITVN